MTITNDMVKVEGFNEVVAPNILEDNGLPTYYSFEAETQEEKIMLFNALNNPSKRVEDCINMEIAVKHILVETVEIPDEQTGEIKPVPRIVLLDEKGESYACASLGMFSALKRAMKIFGEPKSWKKAIKFQVVQQATRNGNNKVLTLKLLG